jgi:hypothetical protein
MRAHELLFSRPNASFAKSAYKFGAESHISIILFVNTLSPVLHLKI